MGDAQAKHAALVILVGRKTAHGGEVPDFDGPIAAAAVKPVTLAHNAIHTIAVAVQIAHMGSAQAPSLAQDMVVLV